MTEVKGPLTTLSHALPAGVDGALLAQWRMKSGLTWEQFQAQVAAALDGLNGDVLSTWGSLIYITTDDYAEYPQGSTLTDVPDATDLDDVDIYKGTTTAHSLPLKHRHQALGGTDPYFFRDARQPTINATVRDAMTREINTFEKKLLTRSFSDTVNTIATNGTDVGFCDGTIFIPPQVGGSSFLSTHNHHTGYNSSSSKTLADALDGAALDVSQHGHPGPFIALVAEADVVTIRALTNYVRPNSDRIVIVDRAGVTSGNQYFTNGEVQVNQKMGSRFIGYYTSAYGEIELRCTARIPTGYVFLYKSYGQNDPRNPIYVRVHPDVGFGWYLEAEPSNSRVYPVKRVEIKSEWGISCGMDRTAGALSYLVAGGTWANPTIA